MTSFAGLRTVITIMSTDKGSFICSFVITGIIFYFTMYILAVAVCCSSEYERSSQFLGGFLSLRRQSWRRTWLFDRLERVSNYYMIES